MALTAVQLNGHLRAIMIDVASRLDSNDETFFHLLYGCARHKRSGDPDDVEAGTWWAEALFESVMGHPATPAELHTLRSHAMPAADAAAGAS